jgi:hypothetical protein
MSLGPKLSITRFLRRGVDMHLERRSQPRFPTDQPVMITVLPGGQTAFPGCIVNVSGRGLQLKMPCRVSPEDFLKVTWGETMLLTEVCYCEPAGQEYIAGVNVEHALYNLAQLADQQREFDGAPTMRDRGRRDHRPIRAERPDAGTRRPM